MNSPPHVTSSAPTGFGIDAPGLVRGFLFGGAGALLLGLTGLHHWPALAAPLVSTGSSGLGSGLLMLASSRLGKPLVLRHLIRRLRLRGDERLLDIGCGRGMLLLEAARHLPDGQAVGVDLWSTRDQSGNAADATWANVRAARLEERVQIDTGDMRQLPYPEAHFDVVVSSLAIHNLPTAADRTRVIHEISRVLRPGGRVALLDFRNTRAYARTLRDAGLHEVRGSLPQLLMFPPCWIVRARKA